MKEYNGRKLIEMDDWTDSFDKIVKPGDYVDVAIVDSFINSVPPAFMRWNHMQCGEPYSHREDPDTGKWRPTFVTFTMVEDKIWKYCGNCFCGEKIERGKDSVYA